MTRHRLIAFIVYAVLTGHVGACSDDILWRDPDVTLLGQGDAQLGPSSLTLGYRDGVFTPLSELSAIPVVDGLQGGTWTMPTLRASSLAPSLATECTLTTATETLGSTRLQIPTRPALGSPFGGPGWVEVPDLPIAVQRTPPLMLDDLQGVPATLTCTVTAAGLSATSTVTAPLALP